MARKRTFQNIIEYLIFLPIAFFLRLLPRRAALITGENLGRLCFYLFPGRRELAKDNIRKSFPEMSDKETRDLCAETFRHLGISVAEMIRLDKFKGRDDLERYFTFIGLGNLDKALSYGRGVLLATAHVGFWEVGSYFLAELGYPTAFVAKKTKNPYINERVVKMRENSGGKLIDAKKGARQIVKTLQENWCVGVLIDHHIRKSEAVQVPFFGRPAWTTPIITQMAMKRNIPVVPIFVYRNEDWTYRVEIDEPIFLEGELSHENVTDNTALLTRTIEDAIRKDPSQWFWVHKRWKN